MKEFEDENLKFDENGRKLSKHRKHCGKRRNCHSVFKMLVLQTRKNQALFGKGLTYIGKLCSFVKLVFQHDASLNILRTQISRGAV